jgi:hypothetical protein
LSFSLAIVSTYFYVDTILVYRFGPFKMGWLDAYCWWPAMPVRLPG